MPGYPLSPCSWPDRVARRWVYAYPRFKEYQFGGTFEVGKVDDDILEILSNVPFGELMRDVHRLGAELMVAVVALHITSPSYPSH